MPSFLAFKNKSVLHHQTRRQIRQPTLTTVLIYKKKLPQQTIIPAQVTLQLQIKPIETLCLANRLKTFLKTFLQSSASTVHSISDQCRRHRRTADRYKQSQVSLSPYYRCSMGFGFFFHSFCCAQNFSPYRRNFPGSNERTRIFTLYSPPQELRRKMWFLVANIVW